MSLSIRCEGCTKSLRAKDELAGKRVRCPVCGHLLAIPEAAAPVGKEKETGQRRRRKSIDRPVGRSWTPWWIALGAGGAGAAAGIIALIIVLTRPGGEPPANPPAPVAVAPSEQQPVKSTAAKQPETAPPTLTPPSAGPGKPVESEPTPPDELSAPAPADLPPRNAPPTLAPIGEPIVTPIKQLPFQGAPIGGQLIGHFLPQRVVFAPDGKEFAGTGQARACWRFEGGFLWGVGTRCETVSFSADGSKVFFMDDSQLTVYDRQSGKELWTCQLGKPTAPQIDRGVTVFAGAVVSPDGKTAYAPTGTWTTKPPGADLTYSEFGISAYEVRGGKELRRFQKKLTARVSCLALSPDGRQLLSGSEDHAVRLWDVATGKELKVLKGHTATITALGWSQDGKRIVTGAHEYDSKLLQQLLAQKQPTDSAQRDGSVRVWDVAAAKELFLLAPEKKPRADLACLSPDGRLLASGDSIWEVGREAPRYVCPLVDQVRLHLLAFSPDGQTVVAARMGSGPDTPAALVRLRFPEAIGGQPPAPAKPSTGSTLGPDPKSDVKVTQVLRGRRALLADGKTLTANFPDRDVVVLLKVENVPATVMQGGVKLFTDSYVLAGGEKRTLNHMTVPAAGTSLWCGTVVPITTRTLTLHLPGLAPLNVDLPTTLLDEVKERND